MRSASLHIFPEETVRPRTKAFAVAAMLAVFLAFVAIPPLFLQAWQRAELANLQQTTSLMLIEELRASSVDLTSMARTYVATGDPKFQARYQEILNIREGIAPRPLAPINFSWDLVIEDSKRPDAAGRSVPLLELMRNAGFTDDELAMLAAAKAASDQLTETEYAAMRLVAESSHQDARIPAMRMLFDDAYLKHKAAIMQPIYDASIVNRQRTDVAVAEAHTTVSRLSLAALLSGVAGAGITIYLYTVIASSSTLLRKLATVYELSATGMVIVDSTTGRILQANRAYAAMHGYECHDLVGKTARDLFSAEERQKAADYVTKAIREGSAVFESVRLRKDGTVFPCSIRLTTYRGRGGEVMFRAATVRDITVQKKVEAELAQHRRDLEATVAQRTEELSAANARLRGTLFGLECWRRPRIEPRGRCSSEPAILAQTPAAARGSEPSCWLTEVTGAHPGNGSNQRRRQQIFIIRVAIEAPCGLPRRRNSVAITPPRALPRTPPAARIIEVQHRTVHEVSARQS